MAKASSTTSKSKDEKSKKKVTEKTTLAKSASSTKKAEKTEIKVKKTASTSANSEKPSEKSSEKSFAQSSKSITQTSEMKSNQKKSPISMAELMSARESGIVTPQKGQMVSGVIVAKNRRALVVDIGAKTEGMVTDKEFSFSQDFINSLKVGDPIEAQVVSTDQVQGHVLLSLRNAALDARWSIFEKALAENLSLEAKGVDVNKGGLIVLVNGLRGFIPSSQFSKQYVTSYAGLKGKTLQVKPIEVDREKNRLIFSERHVSEAEEIALREAAMTSVGAGEIVEGIVSGVMPFGLFVTVKVKVGKEKTQPVEVEGLVHISEISWEKVTHPKEYHATGDKIKVKVLGIDERTGKLNLSIKQLSDDPWITIEERYEPGMTVDGIVSRVESFGVFVNVEEGVDGLIHSSKLDQGSQLKKGESISVHVESVDSKQRRMSLSLVSAEVPMGYK